MMRSKSEPETRQWHPEGALRVPLSSLHLGHLLGCLAGFWGHFAGSAITWQALFKPCVKSWVTSLGKVGTSDFDTSLEQNAVFCRSGHPSWSHLVPKVRPEGSKMASKCQVSVARTVRFGRPVRSCCRSYGKLRAAPQTPLKSEVAGYLSDKTHD